MFAMTLEHSANLRCESRKGAKRKKPAPPEEDAGFIAPLKSN